MLSKGYAFFENPKGHDLNIVGIRTADDDSNSFNDWIAFIYDFHDTLNCFAFPCTTDPGLYWRTNPINVDGTAQLVPGQYRGMWKLGKHKGYSALQQVAPCKVYRDNDKDASLDGGEIDEGLFGINMHRANANKESQQVDKWSAGCTVFSDPLHFKFAMDLCLTQFEKHGYSTFTYTLLLDSDFWYNTYLKS